MKVNYGVFVILICAYFIFYDVKIDIIGFNLPTKYKSRTLFKNICCECEQKKCFSAHEKKEKSPQLDALKNLTGLIINLKYHVSLQLD